MKVDLDPGTLYYDGKISAETYVDLIIQRDSNNDSNLVNAQKCLRYYSSRTLTTARSSTVPPATLDTKTGDDTSTH